jgi:hypothetical protein
MAKPVNVIDPITKAAENVLYWLFLSLSINPHKRHHHHQTARVDGLLGAHRTPHTHLILDMTGYAYHPIRP